MHNPLSHYTMHDVFNSQILATALTIQAGAS